MDFASVLGLVVAAVAILGGFLMEGGHLESIVQPTAALIVCGGTLGALFVQFPMSHVLQAALGLRTVFFAPRVNLEAKVRTLVDLAQKARREGIVSLESDAESQTDPFLKNALQLAVDGTESSILRDALEVELMTADEHGEAGANVFEAGGGYAPTIGILGAVLGLIHVMENLSEPSKLGAGIAVAFVATVYAVALANIVLLPIAGKLKVRHREVMVGYELVLAGVSAIVDGENPRLIEQKLLGFCTDVKPSAETGSSDSLREAA